MMHLRATMVPLLALAALAACSSGQRRGEASDVGTTSRGSSGSGTTTDGVACGPTACPKGQICCNKSCGICTPPDGFCTQQLCETAADAAAGGGGGACKQDSDCRTFSDYCTGCDCRALGKADKDPTCAGPGVRCIVDPCRDRSAACQDGRCVLRASR
jgi:hypothetical protein